MSILVLLSSFAVGIIFSNSITEINAIVPDGKVVFTDENGPPHYWPVQLYHVSNAMNVILKKGEAKEFTKILETVTGNWSIFWTKDAQNVAASEIIYDPISIDSSVELEGLIYLFIRFNRKVEFPMHDSTKLPGTPAQVKGTTFISYLTSTNKIVVKGDLKVLTTFKNLNEKNDQVECVVPTPRNILPFDIQSPVFRDVENDTDEYGELTGLSKLTIEIPLLVDIAINNDSYEGIAYLIQRRIKLFIPPEKMATIETCIGQRATHVVILEEQPMFSYKKFDVVLHNLRNANQADQIPLRTDASGRQVMTLSFDRITESTISIE